MTDILFTPLRLNEFETLIENSVRKVLKEQQKPLPTETEPKYINRSKTAQILGVSHVTLYKWEQSGLLIPYRVGSRVRYLKTEVDNLFKKRT